MDSPVVKQKRTMTVSIVQCYAQKFVVADNYKRMHLCMGSLRRKKSAQKHESHVTLQKLSNNYKQKRHWDAQRITKNTY